jgi:hypothetical protein
LKSFQERRGRITKQSKEAQAEVEAVVEARLRQTQHELRVLILEVVIEEQKTVRQIEEQISKPRTLTTLAQLQLLSLTQEFEALRERKFQQSLQKSKKQQALELINVPKPRDLPTIHENFIEQWNLKGKEEEKS